MARRKYSELVRGATPVTRFVFPRLTTPDTKFKPEGEFKVSIDLEGAAAEDFKKKIEEVYEKEFLKECNDTGKVLARYHGRPYRPATDRDKNEIPGTTRFTFARRAGGTYGPRHPKAGQKWTQKLYIVAADAKTMVTDEIWGGTKGIISYSIVPWWTPALGFGVRLQIEAVQVLELVTQGNVSPEHFGFEAQTGYVPAATTDEVADDVASEEGESSFDF